MKTPSLRGDCTDADDYADDYAEAAQGACDDQPTLEDVVADYNRTNPNAQLTYEE